VEQIDSYVALAPRVLRVGQVESVALSLFQGDRLATGRVQVSLEKDGATVLQQSGVVHGKGTVGFEVPSVDQGDYQLSISGPGFQDSTSVRVEDGTLLFLDTDKPIYKPGQTLHARVLALDADLRPLPGRVTVEVQDAKGTKVFKRELQTDEYGIAAVDMPISNEPNLGVWTLTGRHGQRSTQVDIRVEEYVLPKYEVKVDLPQEWVLADEMIRGQISAEYSFGKPVWGEVEVVASRYVGTWQEFARLTRQIEGSTEFELPAVGYVSGVPGQRGMGNITLEVTVREKGSGYEEKATRLLTVSASPLVLQVIPESSTFKPSLPFSLLVVSETPDNQPVDSDVEVEITYVDRKLSRISREQHRLRTEKGKALLKVTSPTEAVALTIVASAEGARTQAQLEAGYSPSGNFIHLEQTSTGPLSVGDQARFHVHSTKEASNFYYEVVSRGRVIFSGYSRSPDIAFTLTPLMAPSSRLLVYQILPNSEVAADYLPFSVHGDYPHHVEARFSAEEVKPGESVSIIVETEGQARVGLVAVDKSVFILAENRLNLQQVFDELERLYMQPQVELHEVNIYEGIKTRGAQEAFRDVGLLVMSNKEVPQGEKHGLPGGFAFGLRSAADAMLEEAVPAFAPAPQNKEPDALAEVQRVRQFFPETWLWTQIDTDRHGRASLEVEAPDSITTWVLRAVGLSRDKGLGVAESQLRVFQPFFLKADLPYSAIRGEEFPVRVALYNYLAEVQEIRVDLESADWYDLLDVPSKTLNVQGNDIGGVEFRIRPKSLGVGQIKITARSREAADAVLKTLLVEPEGIEREFVDTWVLKAGQSRTVDTSVPPFVVEGSDRAYLVLTGSYLTQTIEGLEGLLRMPFGCGEQNMILMAPNTFVLRYLKATDQLKPEVMARAEKLMITGYQRELTYRRSDGSFSAFGDRDKEGSLWLTAFVLKTFSQASELIYIDEDILRNAREWIAQHQNEDGSFDPVGFVHHQEMMGGLQGKTALTAFATIALLESGEQSAAKKAVSYLEGELEGLEDPYTMALVTYALELAGSSHADQAYGKLMELAHEDEDGLNWGSSDIRPEPLMPEKAPRPVRRPNPSTAVEATGYATLALLQHGDVFNASRAAQWLVSRRNALGGFTSTQDTVVALQALTKYAASSTVDVDLTVSLRAEDWSEDVRVTPENFDVLQVVEVPVDRQLIVEAHGRGEVVLQSVRRFNLPEVDEPEGQAFQIDVTYDSTEIEVNDLLDVSVTVRFDPPTPIEAGMVVLDVSVPTGFVPMRDSLDRVVTSDEKVKRYDVAGRKVIFYIENMLPGDTTALRFQARALRFQARALFPVRAKAVASRAYSYYSPGLTGEALGQEVAVVQR